MPTRWTQPRGNRKSPKPQLCLVAAAAATQQMIDVLEGVYILMRVCMLAIGCVQVVAGFSRLYDLENFVDTILKNLIPEVALQVRGLFMGHR